jgi:hypothetical protein
MNMIETCKGTVTRDFKGCFSHSYLDLGQDKNGGGFILFSQTDQRVAVGLFGTFRSSGWSKPVGKTLVFFLNITGRDHFQGFLRYDNKIY